MGFFSQLQYCQWCIFFFRTIDLNSSLLQQVIERKREVLCILREKIITTQRCTISEHIQTEEKVGGLMGCTAKTVQVKVTKNLQGVEHLHIVWEEMISPNGLQSIFRVSLMC